MVLYRILDVRKESISTMENNNFIGDYDDGPDEHEAILPPMFRMKSINDVDSLLSREMMALTVDDRNAINEEIHGVGTMAPDETSGLIESSLREFQKEVDAIRRVKNNKVVDDFESIDGNNKYVETDSFKLVFLRCELFDAKKAALRYLRYLDLLCDVFGTVALERPLNIAKDFTKDDIKWFRMGHYQLLPFRDRAGRRVFASVADMGFALEDRMRVSSVLFLVFCCHVGLFASNPFPPCNRREVRNAFGLFFVFFVIGTRAENRLIVVFRFVSTVEDSFVFIDESCRGRRYPEKRHGPRILAGFEL